MRNLSYENEFCMQFHFHANQSHLYNNGFAIRLALKQRQRSRLQILREVGFIIRYCSSGTSDKYT